MDLEDSTLTSQTVPYPQAPVGKSSDLMAKEFILVADYMLSKLSSSSYLLCGPL